MRMYILTESCRADAIYIQAYKRIPYRCTYMHVSIDVEIHGRCWFDTVNYILYIDILVRMYVLKERCT